MGENIYDIIADIKRHAEKFHSRWYEESPNRQSLQKQVDMLEKEVQILKDKIAELENQNMVLSETFANDLEILDDERLKINRII